MVRAVEGEDYTETLQSAIDLAKPGAVLVVPAGRHEIGSIRVGRPLTIAGQGAGLTSLVARTGTDRTLVRVEGTSGVTIRDISIDGNRTAQSGGYPHGVQFSRSTSCTVTRVAIRHCGRSGISVYDGSDYTTVTDSVFLDNENDVEIHGSGHARVTGNAAVGTRYESYSCYEEEGGSGLCHENVIEGNSSEDSYCCVNVERSGRNTVRSNVARNTHYGIHVSGHGGSLTTGNLISGNSVSGGPLSTAYGIVVKEGATGNALSGNTVAGWLGTTWSICDGNTVSN